MLQAQIYYYPSGLGHVGINIIFDKDDLPAWWRQKKVKIKLFHEKDWEHSPSDRYHYIPALFSKGNGEYSVWGYKNHQWQETLLTNLSLEERTWLENLNFPSDADSYLPKIEQKLPVSMYSLIQQGHPDLIQREFFFDWGGSYDFAANKRSRGDVLRIDLPPMQISWSEFWGATKELGRERLYSDYPESSYNLFTNNCAHSVMDLLYCAGYLSEKPNSSFDLFPIVAAIKASKLADTLRPVFRKQLIEHKEKFNESQLIHSLIQMSCNRLRETIYFNWGNFFGGCAPELTRLTAIKYDGSPESIERLLHAAEMASPYTRAELNECIALVAPQQCFLSCVARLETIANQLKNKENKLKLHEITIHLQQEFESFQANTTSYQQFSKNCSEWIEKATPILEKENSLFLQVLKNIAIAVCGLVVFYLAAAFINKSNSGNFLFFNEPALSLVTKTMQSNIDSLAQPCF